MNPYDLNAPIKTNNLCINSDLLRRTKDCHINLSKVSEQRLVELLLEEKRCKWQEANHDAIETYNRRIEACVVFSDGLRTF